MYTIKLRTSQYIVNYKDKDAFERLNKFGSVSYYSKVLNVLFIDTDKGEQALRKVKGVTFVKPTLSRLYGNKR